MGYGDDIMATAEARKLKHKFKSHKILIGDGKQEYLSSVFWHNPNIDHAIFAKQDDDVIWVKDYPSHRPYINYSRSTKDKLVFRKFKPAKGDLYFTDSEMAEAKRALMTLRSFVVIEPNVHGKYGAANRDWGFDKWQKVVNLLRHKTDFVQLGRPDSSSLKGVTRIITENFRAACAVLSLAKLFVGTEGGLHHAAAALDVGAIVIFGGRISPEMTGYTNHTNLYVKHPQSPCGRISSCEHCKKCLEKISIQRVVNAIKKKLHTAG